MIKIFNISNSILSRSLSILNTVREAGHISLFQSSFFSSFSNISRSSLCSNLKLTPYNPLVLSSCGMKVRGILQLRCKNCYMERKDGVLQVMCTSYGRHKQRAITLRKKRSWILTSVSQCKHRPW